MGFFIILLIIVGFFYMFSKSTSYGPKGFMGGYSETQMGNDMYAVKFQGNGNTRPDKSVDFCMLRSADLTLEKGYKFFCDLSPPDFAYIQSQPVLNFLWPIEVLPEPDSVH